MSSKDTAVKEKKKIFDAPGICPAGCYDFNWRDRHLDPARRRV